MNLNPQLVMDRPKVAKADSPTSTIRNILVHVADDQTLADRLEASLSIARACSAHLSCLHVTPIQAYATVDGLGNTFMIGDLMDALDERAEKLRARIENELRGEDVSWDYVRVTGDVADQIVSQAALADLIVTSREPHRIDFVGKAISLLGDMLCRSRTPLFIPAGRARVDAMGPALIAWNGSYEAANAVRSSLGLLRLAPSVHVFHVRKGEEQLFSETRLLEYLSRHGIHAELNEKAVDNQDEDFLTALLTAEAAVVNAGYMVMGGYSHSRVREFVFGGVTRKLLAESSIPLVIGH